jgi:hypothetical protein
LGTQSAEYSHRSWLLFFILYISKTKSFSGSERSPLAAGPQQFSISVLGLPVSHPSADTLNLPTGTVFGNSSFVSLLRRLKNWLGVVLHSRLSKWNSSSTRKVNTVFGLRNVAGKSPAIINCMSRSGASEQRHQATPISWTPDLSTTVMIGFPSLSRRPGFKRPKPRSPATSFSSLLPTWPSSSSQSSCILYFSKWD